MNIKFLGFAFAAAMTITTGAHATAIASGTPILSSTCAVLGENVTLNLSRGVTGAYECSEANNSINVAACHEAGSRTDQVACVVVGSDTSTSPATPIYSDPSCNASNVGTTITVTPPRYRGYVASTTGGSVGAQQLSGVCNSTTIEALVD